jgi:hypothetical protein
MGLKLGKSFNRSYNLRVPIMNGFYNIGIFFDKRSTFLLFKLDRDFEGEEEHQKNIKVNMFKNLEASKFCETFVDLHNFRKNTLDISNQFEKIKPEYTSDIIFVFNESIVLSKVEIDDKSVFDCLNIYGFTLESYSEEFVFILTERHNIQKRLGKKIVRTSGLQIATTASLEMLDDYHKERKTAGRLDYTDKINRDKVIKLSEFEDKD